MRMRRASPWSRRASSGRGASRGIGFLSTSALEREEEASLEQASRVESARRTRLSLERESAALGHEMATARSRAQAQLAAVDLQRAALDQEQAERDAQFHATLVAPISGVIGTILVEPGQVVTPGMTLATLIPADASLEAHLYTPSRSIGFVRNGQTVLLRYLAYPHQKFGSQRARVTAVSKIRCHRATSASYQWTAAASRCTASRPRSKRRPSRRTAARTAAGRHAGRGGRAARPAAGSSNGSSSRC
jgi:membrane fusion protein